MRTLLVLTAAVGLLGADARAEEAVLPDGRRLHGEITLGQDGRLRFRPVKQGTILVLDQIDQVRFPAAPVPTMRFPLVHQVCLRDGQQLTGELLGIDERSVRLRTDWAATLTLPRTGVTAVLQPSGFVTAFVEDFEGDLRAWTLTGKPVRGTRERTSGVYGLCLNAMGPSATYGLPMPLESGRVGLNFLDAEVPRPVRGRVEFVFQTPEGPQELRVTVVDGDSKTASVELPTRVRSGLRVARTGGWRRLRIEFAAGFLQILVDDLVLYSSRQQGPGGTLRQVRLVRENGKPPGGNGEGELWFDDFSVSRRVPELPPPEGDAEQDELWLLPGDELFGSISRADRRKIEMLARFGLQSLTWAEVRGLLLRQEKPSAPAVKGERVRLGLRSGYGAEPDWLVGVVQALDPQRLLLRHALLGDVAVPRERLHRLQRWPDVK